MFKSKLPTMKHWCKRMLNRSTQRRHHVFTNYWVWLQVYIGSMCHSITCEIVLKPSSYLNILSACRCLSTSVSTRPWLNYQPLCPAPLRTYLDSLSCSSSCSFRLLSLAIRCLVPKSETSARCGMPCECLYAPIP